MWPLPTTNSEFSPLKNQVGWFWLSPLNLGGSFLESVNCSFTEGIVTFWVSRTMSWISFRISCGINKNSRFLFSETDFAPLVPTEAEMWLQNLGDWGKKRRKKKNTLQETSFQEKTQIWGENKPWRAVGQPCLWISLGDPRGKCYFLTILHIIDGIMRSNNSSQPSSRFPPLKKVSLFWGPQKRVKLNVRVDVCLGCTGKHKSQIPPRLDVKTKLGLNNLST